MKPSIFAREKPFRSLWVLALVCSFGVGLSLAACGGKQATEQAIEQTQQEAAQVEKEPMGKEKTENTYAGSFDLTFTGDLHQEVKGRADCTLDPDTHQLRAALEGADTTAFPYLVEVGVPDYHGTDSYTGLLELSGPARSSGSVDAGIEETAPQEEDFFEAEIKMSLSGDYAGAAGNGSLSGQVDCGLAGPSED